MIKNYIRKEIKAVTTKFSKRFLPEVYQNKSYSQAGEDVIINFLLKDKKKESITYLDLGTSHPISYNNTYLFYEKGNSGVLVEAEKKLIPIIKEIRPKDKVIYAGVNTLNDNSLVDFYTFENSALNTFDKNEALNRDSYGNNKIIKIEKVNSISINTVIEQNFENFPDLLSIDIEGLDLEVLKTLDFEKYPIPVICVETCEYSENHIRNKNSEIAIFMTSKNYFVYADTYINTIFVNKNWFNQ